MLRQRQNQHYHQQVKKVSCHSQKGLDVQASVADLLHHVIPAARIRPRPAGPSSPVTRRSSRTPPDPARASAVACVTGASVKLAKALRGDWGVVGARRGLVSEGLLQALLSDQGSRARHGRGGNVLQGGSRREGSISKTEQTQKTVKKG